MMATLVQLAIAVAGTDHHAANAMNNPVANSNQYPISIPVREETDVKYRRLEETGRRTA